MRSVALIVLLVLLACVAALSQVPISTGVQILKAEDARRYDSVLEEMMRSPNAAVRERAALAAGRIGDEKSVPALAALLKADVSANVRAMAAFGLGETESKLAVDPVRDALGTERAPSVRARLVEAAGKIAAANAADAGAPQLAAAIVDVLQAEFGKGSGRDRDTVLLGITAVLRTKAKDGDVIVARFLSDADARIRADAGNTLTRLKATNANETLRHMLASDTDPVARANAARALGAAGDKGAVDLLIRAATSDADSRVRVSAIRALASLGDAKAADALLDRGKVLMGNFAAAKTQNKYLKNEALEVASALGRLLANSGNKGALAYLRELFNWGRYRDPETAIAWAQIDPKNFLDQGGLRVPDPHATVFDWQADSAYAQALAELAKSKDREIVNAGSRRAASDLEAEKDPLNFDHRAAPEKIRALAAFKPGDISSILRAQLKQDDVITRATAAELLAEQPISSENMEALKSAFSTAYVKDKDYDDAQLAIMDALFKLDKKQASGSLLVAVNAPDYLVRKKAFDLLSDKDLQKEMQGIPTSLEIARAKHKDQVLPYTSAFGTKLGQVLNTDADYRRALSRKNGTVKAVLNTEVGTFTIDLLPEDAPLTVDNFVKLARSGYFNGVYVHRVVPNFVMQDGDPRGDGNGGPGWSIRCEINMVPYDRGAVGMALSGKDTGGSQWFVTHSPQPHLDGGYTVFGHVNETDMKVVDNISRGTRILGVRIEEIASRKNAKKRKK